MPSHGFRPPKFFVFALALSPVLVFLHACRVKDRSTSQSPEPLLSRSQPDDRTVSSSHPETRPLRPPRSNLPPALQNLTTAKADQIHGQLQANAQLWPSQIAPFYRTWGALDPEAALRSASTEGKLSLAATFGTVEGWATRDPERARDWIEQQESPALRTRYAGALVKAWPVEDLLNLAAWARNEPSLLPRVTVRWSGTDPQGAARWLGSLSDGRHQQRATETLFRLWAKTDPGAAGDYLVTAREFANRDAALAAYASTVVSEAPEAAAAWAREISNPELRERILQALPPLRPTIDSSPVLSGSP